MGMSEDDRIRSKNKVYNAAHDEYEELKRVGMSDEEILIVAKFPKSEADKTIRNDIFLTIQKIVERNRSEETR